MWCRNQFEAKSLKIRAIDINIHTRESMIVGLCRTEQIFTIPDSYLLAIGKIAKPLVGKHNLWRIFAITR
jgi:hypothetical protein